MSDKIIFIKWMRFYNLGDIWIEKEMTMEEFITGGDYNG